MQKSDSKAKPKLFDPIIAAQELNLWGFYLIIIIII